MHKKHIGDPCPICRASLIRRRSNFRTIVGDVAFCARCCSSFEICEAPADRTATRRAALVPAPAM
jgi:hypothetical protein